MRRLLKPVRILLRSLPIVGPLADVRLADHKEAALEVGLNVLLSTVPFWLGAFLMLTSQETQESWFHLIIINMKNGELFLYSTALLGPLYYFIHKEYSTNRTFPSTRWFSLISSLILIFSVGMFAIRRAGSIFGKELKLDDNFLFSASWKLYICALFIVYIAHVYKNFQETGAAFVGVRDTEEFVSRYTEGDDDESST